MYDGFIYSTKYHEKAGYNTRIHSTVNGKNILISYFHLQENNRILETSSPLTYVKAGDIIGYQGDSGNLKAALKKKSVASHVHIETREHDESSSWAYTLRFTGNVGDIYSVKPSRELKEDYKRYFVKQFKNDKERAMLHFLKDIIKIHGINLYLIKNNGDVEKKTLKEDERVDTNDCE
jgi:murein DD-endopeptidase MepM/ murein hydrolase activator NlpD